MAGTRVLLTLNKILYEALGKEAKSNYMSIQEYINYILRKEIIKQGKK